MRTIEIELETGLVTRNTETGDDIVRKIVVLRELSAADIIDSEEESEKLVTTEQGAQLVSSPALMGMNMLRRQIVKVGDLNGPLTIQMLKKLTALDLATLQNKAAEFDTVAINDAIEQAAKRGRNEGDGEASGADGGQS